MAKGFSGFTLLAAAGAAALATYFLDAQQGRRRRAQVQDKLQGAMSEFERAKRSVSVDFQNRMQGIQTLARQRRLPQLSELDVMRSNWGPSTRLVTGATGALAFLAMRRSPLLRLAGLALAVRAATNLEAKRLLGAAGTRSIDVEKTLHIAVSPTSLYQFWRDFENFPRIMRNVKNVQRNPDGTWRWEVAGPLGATVQFDSQVTQDIPNEVIAWSTTPESKVQSAGLVRFQPDGGGTRVHVRMSYNPVAGALGHAVATLFGADPQTEMDEDLARLKGFLETGTPARDAAQPLRT